MPWYRHQIGALKADGIGSKRGQGCALACMSEEEPRSSIPALARAREPSSPRDPCQGSRLDGYQK